MASLFDHEKLRVYQDALGFVKWLQPVLDSMPIRSNSSNRVYEERTDYEVSRRGDKEIKIRMMITSMRKT